MLWAVALLVLAWMPAQASPLEVRACGGANEWPPSSYFLRRDGRVTGDVAGFSPDVLAAALQGSRFKAEVTLLPFARCLAEARAGQQMHIVMAAFHNAQRTQSFLYSESYLALVPRVYFLAAEWPKGLALSSLNDLGAYRLCGLNGISYAHLGPVADKVYTGAADYAALVRMLQARRCDAFVEGQEVINGFRLLGTPELSGALLASAALPEVKPLRIHFIVSRQYEHAQPLINAINGGLARLQREQRLPAMLQRHQAAP
ncbi:transporter substrate-binding domain-containing protein [Piscinibacter sp. XHJ-5]|uniref:substrate-binding periplasmic protein n=1 Tax=Piscinibacter sp. XHJ-5 TaxID=3037797 RepID=UPI002452C96F|nr:transporter substrate-binding domain-containing protein [Piscinibacter sp. XHJ-5]